MASTTDAAKGTGAAASVPDWASEALNGGSMRVPRPWHRDDLVPGDFLAGTVAQRGAVTLIISAESGTLGGEPLEAGGWFHIELDCGILKSFVRRDDPQLGDRIVLRFLGRSGARARHDYACGLHRPQPWQ